MEKQFVPFEIAKLLKNIGFDELCFYTYVDKSLFRSRGVEENVCQKNSNFVDDDEIICAPLYQQVFDWFATKHNLFHEITYKRCYPDNAISSCETYCHVYDETGKECMFDDGVRDYNKSEIACIECMINIVNIRENEK